MPRTRGAFFMAEHATIRKPRRPYHERLIRFIIANAITLAIVFVLALPLSYIVGQRVIRHRALAQLDSADPAVFEDAMDYVYLHAPDDFRVRKEAVQRVQSLPPERAAELFWVLAQAMTRDGEPLPPLEVAAGSALLERSDFAQKFVVYNQLEQLGVGLDERVLAALAAILEDPDDRRFLQAVAFYDSRFLWLRDNVPADAWLRWAMLLSSSDAALTQLRSAELLGDMPDALDDPRIAEGLSRLAGSTNPAVRGKVLDVAAGYARVASDPVPYEQVLIALTEDENQTLSRRAWITLGLLNPLSGFSADWRSVEPAIAEAMLWAVVKTNPDRPEPAIEAWDAGLAYEAALALHQSPELEKQYTERSPLDTGGTRLMQGVLSNPGTADERLLYWRCLPVLRRNLMWLWTERELVYQSLFSDPEASAEIQVHNSKLIAGTCFYTGSGFQPTDADASVRLYQIAWHESLPTLPSELTQDRPIYYEALGQLWRGIAQPDRDDPFYEIDFEGIDPSIFEKPLANQFSESPPWEAQFYLKVHGNWGLIDHISDEVLAALGHSAITDLLVVGAACPTFRGDFGRIHSHEPYVLVEQQLHLSESLLMGSVPEQRHAGALIAGMSKSHPTLIEGITAGFIRKHPGLNLDNLHGYTDAQLTDLGLERVDALSTLLDIVETAADREDRYEQIALLKLALWMRGDLGDEFTPEAEAMLEDDRLPTPTVLMCLLHMHRPAALYYLFDREGADPGRDAEKIDLYDLFVNQRWWHVFSRLVPDPDLDLWLWGDPGAQAFQFEVMRQWVQVNRWRLQSGWWPGDNPQ